MTPEEKLIVDRVKATYADVDEMQKVFDIVTKTLALREAEIEELKAEWHAEIERSKRYAEGYEKIIAVRDAEIVRLKELAESWKGGHSIAALDRDLAKDQIKRLEEALQRQDNAIIDKDAEIERLKRMYAEMFCFREDLTLENMELRAQIEGLKNCSDLNWIRLKALLIRAADALDESTKWRADFFIYDDLIAELRKGTE